MRVAADYERTQETMSEALSIYDELARCGLLSKEKCIELSTGLENGQLIPFTSIEHMRCVKIFICNAILRNYSNLSFEIYIC